MPRRDKAQFEAAEKWEQEKQKTEGYLSTSRQFLFSFPRSSPVSVIGADASPPQSLPFSISLLLYFIHFIFSFSDRLHDPFDCFIHLDLWVQTAVTVNIGKIGNAQRWHLSLFVSLSLFLLSFSFFLSMDHNCAGMLGLLNGFAVVRELNSASAFRGVNLAVSRSVCSDVCVGDNG